MKEITPVRKSFLLAYNKHQKTVPDIDAIAEELGYTKRTVATLISRYRKEGLISNEKRARKL